MIQEVKLLLQTEAEAIQNIPVTDDYEKAVELIYTSVHENKGKVVTTGMGKAGITAHNIATTFSSTGTPGVFLHAGDAQHGDMGIIQPGDVLLLISNSGKTRELVELVELSRRMYPGLPIILITGNKNSTLAEISDIVIFNGGPEEICPIKMTPTTSSTMMTVICDVLVVLMIKKINFTIEEYAQRHHGGYLGEKSRQEVRKKNGKNNT